MQEEIKVSVIIPTHNRKKELRKLLVSLEEQTYPKENFEVIVVDDGSTDGTGLLVKEMVSKFELNLNYISVSKQHNSAVVRNIGVQKAKGEILTFIDSDCIAHQEWLRNIIKIFNNQKIGSVGGPELTHPDDSFFVKCCSFSVTCPFTTGGIRGKRGMKLGKYYPRSFNMAIPVKVFKEVNGFDESFKHSHDIEINCRIKERGYNLVYAPDALVYHRRPDTIIKNVKQLFRMGAYRIAVARVHKIALEPIYFLPSIMLLSGVILIIGAFFSDKLFFVSKCFYSGVVLYLLLIGFVGIAKLKDFRAFFMVPLVFLLHQFAYAVGFIYGLLKLMLKKRD